MQARTWTPRLAALAAVALMALLVARYWHPVYRFTSFLVVDASREEQMIPAFRELFVYTDDGGYDGQYYAQIAYDPSLRAPELPEAIDNLSYRARRILLPALAWGLALGQGTAIVHVYSVLNLAAWGLLALLLWRRLAVRDLRGWLAWSSVMFCAGTLSSVRFSLTDLPMLVLMLLAMTAAERGRLRGATAWLAASALTRETALLGAAGLVERPWLSRRNLFVCAGALLPLLAWLAYIRWTLGATDSGIDNFTLPVAGFVRKLGSMLEQLWDPNLRLWAAATLLANLSLWAQAAWFALRWREHGDPWWRLGSVHGLFMIFLGWAVWEGHPGAAPRVLLPLSLAFAVLALRRRASIAWMIVANLGALSGLLLFSDAGANAREVFAERGPGGATVIRLEAGWHGSERNARNLWAWSAGRGSLRLEARAGRPVEARLEFKMRSLLPRTVRATVGGVEVWRAQVGERLQPASIVLSLKPGRTILEFSSDSPPARAAEGTDTRDLAFALYDPKLRIP